MIFPTSSGDLGGMEFFLFKFFGPIRDKESMGIACDRVLIDSNMRSKKVEVIADRFQRFK